MKLRIYLFLAVTVACAAREKRDKNAPIKLPPPQAAFERQIVNAQDAGEGDYQVRMLRQRMAAEPDNLQVRLDLAKRYEAVGSPELALEHYRLAAARFPDSSEIHLLLAKSLRQAGQLAQAAAALETFLQSHPQKTPECSSWLGIVRDEMRQLPDAERAHRDALALAPGADYLHNNLGYNLLMQGKNDAATAEFQAALRLNPRSVVARNNLSLALANKPEQAVQNLLAVTDTASAHNNMAALLIEQGRYEEARKELDLALGYNRNHTAALNNLRLVSQLDGKPAFIRIKPVQNRWTKMKSGLWKAFIEDQEQQRSTPTTTTPENRRGL
jgi:Flp pilus assembly protein TadD